MGYRVKSEKDYLDNFPEFIVKWTEEMVEIKQGKRKEDSWITHGGLESTSLGKNILDNASVKFDETNLNILYYVGYLNHFNEAPSIELISQKFFKGDFKKTIERINMIILCCAVQFLENEPD